ncbi:MAG: hypothetical protein ACI4EQ_00350 [Lachnospiraceae bacterium]
MRLDYASLLSPFPFLIEKVGSIKSPLLREIWNPKITYQGYNMYLSLLFLTPQTYYEQMAPSQGDRYQSLSEEEKAKVCMFDLIADNAGLRDAYLKMLDFFLVEHVLWNPESKVFLTFTGAEDDSLPVGVIHRGIFSELCDIILQRCGIDRKDADMDISKTQNKKALEIVNKIKKGRQAAGGRKVPDKAMELPNLICAVAAKSNSLNFTNIWDLTVFQLYEQFKREQANVYFDIQKMTVAAYGNKQNSFTGSEWFKN